MATTRKVLTRRDLIRSALPKLRNIINNCGGFARDTSSKRKTRANTESFFRRGEIIDRFRRREDCAKLFEAHSREQYRISTLFAHSKLGNTFSTTLNVDLNFELLVDVSRVACHVSVARLQAFHYNSDFAIQKFHFTSVNNGLVITALYRVDVVVALLSITVAAPGWKEIRAHIRASIHIHTHTRTRSSIVAFVGA